MGQNVVEYYLRKSFSRNLLNYVLARNVLLGCLSLVLQFCPRPIVCSWFWSRFDRLDLTERNHVKILRTDLAHKRTQPFSDGYILARRWPVRYHVILGSGFETSYFSAQSRTQAVGD